MTDCLIVGAGPAGGAAAYHLAQQGYSVTVLEKSAWPRSRPCGGGISPAVANWFDFDFAPAISTTVNQVIFTWQQGDRVEANLSTEPMWMVKRDEFDAFLMTKAVEQGVILQPETEVTQVAFQNGQWQVSTNQGELSATYLLAADGVNGLRQQLGFKPAKTTLAATAQLGSAPTHPHQARFDFGTVKNGFIWQFPTADGVTLNTAVMTGKAKEADLMRCLRDYVGQSNLAVQVVAIALWSGQQDLQTQNALLVGDAAGLADPLLAEGIRPALLSGVKAADAIAAALGGNTQALENYSQVMQQEWGNDMVWAQRLGGVFYKFPKIGYKVGVKQPVAVKLLSQILCGQLKYSDITDRAIKSIRKKMMPFGS